MAFATELVSLGSIPSLVKPVYLTTNIHNFSAWSLVLQWPLSILHCML